MTEKRIRISVDFPESVVKDIEQLAAAQGKTKAGLLRDAVALEQWFNEINQKGDHVLVERDGKLREIVRR